jgi:hypothetical protein
VWTAPPCAGLFPVEGAGRQQLLNRRDSSDALATDRVKALASAHAIAHACTVDGTNPLPTRRGVNTKTRVGNLATPKLPTRVQGYPRDFADGKSGLEGG